MAVRSNKIYNTIVMRLRRAGFSKTGANLCFHNSGGIASFLYELYTKKNGVAYKSELISHKIMADDDGLTNEFLKSLCRNNFIKWDMTENIKNGLKPYQTFAGSKLADLLEKNPQEQRVTKRDLIKLEASIEATNQDLQINYISIARLSKYIRVLIETFNPPYTSDTHRQWYELIMAEHQAEIESLINKKKQAELPF